jgi:hypothetical protein
MCLFSLHPLLLCPTLPLSLLRRIWKDLLPTGPSFRNSATYLDHSHIWFTFLGTPHTTLIIPQTNIWIATLQFDVRKSGCTKCWWKAMLFIFRLSGNHMCHKLYLLKRLHLIYLMSWISPVECNYRWWKIHRINCNYVPKRHLRLQSCDGDIMHFLWGIIKCFDTFWSLNS